MQRKFFEILPGLNQRVIYLIAILQFLECYLLRLILVHNDLVLEAVSQFCRFLDVLYLIKVDHYVLSVCFLMMIRECKTPIEDVEVTMGARKLSFPSMRAFCIPQELVVLGGKAKEPQDWLMCCMKECVVVHGSAKNSRCRIHCHFQRTLI